MHSKLYIDTIIMLSFDLFVSTYLRTYVLRTYQTNFMFYRSAASFFHISYKNVLLIMWLKSWEPNMAGRDVNSNYEWLSIVIKLRA